MGESVFWCGKLVALDVFCLGVDKIKLWSCKGLFSSNQQNAGVVWEERDVGLVFSCFECRKPVWGPFNWPVCSGGPGREGS